MKFNDDITLAIAQTVRDVLEGKKPAVKEGLKLSQIKSKFRSQISKFQKGGDLDKKAEDALLSWAFDNNEVKSDDSDEIDAWLTDYVSDKKEFDKLREKNLKEVEQPRPEGEKKFKAKHTVRKSGESPDGKVTKDDGEDYYTEAVISSIDESVINERLKKRPGRGKETLDIDFVGDNKLRADAKKKHKVNIKVTGQYTADVSGEKKGVLAFLQDPDMYGMDDGDIEDLFPELFEKQLTDEESEKQKKYQAFFAKTLKKFGVKSPSELEGEKKKEFFDYIDKNWKSTDEESGMAESFAPAYPGRDFEPVKSAFDRMDPTKFHLKSMGKPVVIHSLSDTGNGHVDLLYYYDGEYILMDGTHKEIRDFQNAGNEGTVMAKNNKLKNRGDLISFAKKDASDFSKILRITDKVRNFKKAFKDGTDTAPKSIGRVPFKDTPTEA